SVRCYFGCSPVCSSNVPTVPQQTGQVCPPTGHTGDEVDVRQLGDMRAGGGGESLTAHALKPTTTPRHRCPKGSGHRLDLLAREALPDRQVPERRECVDLVRDRKRTGRRRRVPLSPIF